MLSLVGSGTAAGTLSADATLTLPGGIAEGDVVYVAFMQAGSSNLDLSMASAGYTELADLYQNDSTDTNLGVFRKVMGATPDSQAICNNAPSGAAVAAFHCWRGCDSSTPEDATTATGGAIDSGTPNPPSITTVTNDAVVLAIGASSEADAVTSAPSGFSNLVDLQGSSLNVMMSSQARPTAGAIDPGTYSQISGTTADSWAAATVAIRPASAVNITGTVSVTEAADTSAASGTITNTATLAVTEALDTLSASGTLTVSGSLSVTEAADTLSASGALTVSGSVAITEANDTLSAVGDVEGIVSGSVAVTEADDALAASGALTVEGSVAVNEAADALVASGALLVSGSVSVTEANDVSAISGFVTVTATVSVSEADDVLDAAGSVPLPVSGSVSIIEADDVLVASGEVEITAPPQASDGGAWRLLTGEYPKPRKRVERPAIPFPPELPPRPEPIGPIAVVVFGDSPYREELFGELAAPVPREKPSDEDVAIALLLAG